MRPLTDEELESRLELLSIPDAGRAYIRETRNSPPSRRVASSGRLNTTWRVASTKMRHSEACESSLEKHFALGCDLDVEVLEHWGQPPQIRMPTPGRRGCKSAFYTPDFLVIQRESIWIAQVKYEADCHKKQEERPYEWICKADGSWSHLPADDYFASIGIPHRVITERSICPIKTENLELVRKTLELAPPEEDIYLSTALVLNETPVLSLLDLAGALGLIDLSPLIQLIGAGVLLGDIERRLISNPHSFLVATDLHSLERAQYIEAESAHADGCVAPHSKDGLIAADRIRQLRNEAPLRVSKRTRYRWRKAYEECNSIGDLVPRHRFKGSRRPRQSEWHRELIARVIDEHYGSSVSITRAAVYRRYLYEHSKTNEQLPQQVRQQAIAQSTFYNLIDQQNSEQLELQRAGRRRANAVRSPVDPRLRDVPPGRPLQRVHIDHQQLALHVVVAHDDDEPLFSSPWLTAMRDECTGMILAFSLSFKEPSARSCCMVLRNCALVHARLPENITVDNGSDFNSTYFETTLAYLNIHKQSRPPGAPRFGASIESAFGSMQSHIENFPGNKRNDERRRAASNSHKGKTHAILNFEQTWQAVEDYIQILNSAGGDLNSPRQRHNTGLTRFPASGHTVTFNHDFLRITAPKNKSTIQLDSARGLHYAKKHYRSPELNHLPDRTRLSVCEEPWDSNRIYAIVGDKMVTCLSRWSEDLTARELARSALLAIPDIECADIKRRIERKKSIRKAAAMEEAVTNAASSAKARSSRKSPPHRLNSIRLHRLDDLPLPYDTEGNE